MSMWGGRFEGGLDETFEAFNKSLGFDQRLLADDLVGSLAWARALGEAGVLTSAEVTELEAAIEGLGVELASDPAPIAASEAEDVHSFVEGALEERVGALARKLHTGRSRNDQVATDLKLYLTRFGREFDGALRDLIEALVELAGETFDLALPGYTHLQRAQPITAGHHALAYVEMLARDAERIEDALERMDTSPLGCGALAGTAFPIDREALADDLGFTAGPTRNSLDAVSDRDHALELAFACSVIMVHLSRLAEDWIFLASSEAGMLQFGDAVSTGSSLMPQKKNPDAMELLRGKTGRVIGALQSLLVTCKGLPMAYDKDLQEDKEALFDALDTTHACLRVAAVCVRNVRYDREACRAACSRGFLDATDVADLLVAAGVAFRDAHQRVGHAVREAIETGVELRELAPERRQALFPEIEEDLVHALSIERVLGRRAAIGGTSPERVAEEVAAWKERLESW
ncbi:MAG: argininosuccinate lyase [bacterium]|nr:argininosuccinate lyase [bacterium]